MSEEELAQLEEWFRPPCLHPGPLVRAAVDEVRRLRKEEQRLSEWCLEWRKKYTALEEQLKGKE